MKEKKCKSCLLTLPVDKFTRSKVIKDGYENKCKNCRQEARKKYTKSCEVCNKSFKTAKKETIILAKYARMIEVAI